MTICSIPFDKADNSTGYTTFPSDKLEIGYLVHSVGDALSSPDLLMLLLFNASPEERGLVPQIGEAGADRFLFPDNYAEIVLPLMTKQKEKAKRKRLQTKQK